MSAALSYSNRAGGPAGIIASAPRQGTPTATRPGQSASLMNTTVSYYNTTTNALGLDKNSIAASNRYSSLLSYNRTSFKNTGTLTQAGYSASTAAEQTCVTTRPVQAARVGTTTGRSSSIPASNRTARLTKTPSNYWDQKQSASTTPRLSTVAAWGTSNAYAGSSSYNNTNSSSTNNNAPATISPNPSYQQRAATPGRSRLSYYSNTSIASNAYFSTTANINNNATTLAGSVSVANANTAMSMNMNMNMNMISNPPKPLRNARVTLILDLDETLVHSSFDPIPADLHIPLVMDGEHYVAYVNKRPHVERFLARCVELFDVIVWTASLSVYAEPLINELCRMARCGNLKKMYREHCTEVAGGGYVKDLSSIGRPLDDVVILDNSPSVAVFQPSNLINIVSWYDDMSDTALLELIPLLEHLTSTPTVYHSVPQLNQVMCKQIGN